MSRSASMDYVYRSWAYNAFCVCHEAFVGQSRRTIKARCKEHERLMLLINLRMQHQDRSLNKFQWYFNIDRTSRSDCLIKEGIEIQLNTSNLRQWLQMKPGLVSCNWTVNQGVGPSTVSSWLHPPTCAGSWPKMSRGFRQVCTRTHTHTITKMVRETLVYLLFNHMPWLLSSESFSEFSHCESFRLYTDKTAFLSDMFNGFQGTDVHVQYINWCITLIYVISGLLKLGSRHTCTYIDIYLFQVNKKITQHRSYETFSLTAPM